MKNLILVTLFCAISVSGMSQRRPPRPKQNIRPMIERKAIQENRVLTVIAANVVIFALNEYALHTDNTALRQGCTAAYFATNIAGATWVLSINTHMDNRKFKTRVKQNFRSSRRY